mgnify:CR=1 FL=1
MNTHTELLHEHLMETSPEFKKLVEDHRALDTAACDLSDSSFLTNIEKEKLNKLKRQKLLIRDKIARCLKQAEDMVPVQ